MGRLIWSIAMVIWTLATAGQAEVTVLPKAQAAVIFVCLALTDEKIGVMAGRCLDLVAGPCRNLPGQTTNDVAGCSLREAEIWAGLLDRELGLALQDAQETDLRCVRARNGACPKTRDFPGQVEVALRRSQRDWVQMLTSTCDYAGRSYGEGTAGLTFYASCLRDLVFSRQQLFWRNRTQGYGLNDNQAAIDVHYAGEVVPFAFR